MGVKTLWIYRKILIATLTPLLLLPLPVVIGTNEAKCAFVVFIMAIFWLTGALPVGITALIPVVLMPALGLMSSKDLCKKYFNDTIMLFVGGLVVAIAIEKVNLHKRIALRVLLLVGSEPKWLMFGFMIPTAFLSMWISNTATTAMMVPIAHAVMVELKNQYYQTTMIEMKNQASEANHESSTDAKPNSDDEEASLNYQPTKPDAKIRNICKGLTLCVAYAANIGGTATLIGTGTNLVLKGQLDTLFGSGTGVNFGSWFAFAFPNMVVLLVVAWLWLQLMFLGWRSLFTWRCKRNRNETITNIIRTEYKALGAMKFEEWSVFIHFIVLAILWITREPEFVPGWGHLFAKGYVTDATASVAVLLSLFIWPAQPPCLPTTGLERPPSSLMTWQIAAQKLPWGIILVIGGGFALASVCKESGLSSWIGERFAGLQHIPAWAIVTIICAMVGAFTEITSNIATATIFLPILAELAINIGVNPLYLMISCAIATSFAFMLPVATPPNAIVFAYDQIRIIDMVKAGFILNVLSIIVLNISLNTYGRLLFHFDKFPAWASDSTFLRNSSVLVTNATHQS